MTLARRPMFAVAAVAVAVLLWFAWGWFRDSSLVKVRHVEITGVSNSPDADAIKRELKQAALGMTSLDVDTRKLDHSVSGYPIVRAVSADVAIFSVPPSGIASRALTARFITICSSCVALP